LRGTTRPGSDQGDSTEVGASSPALPALVAVPMDLLLAAPNRITLVRTAIAMAIAAWAFHTGSWQWLIVGYVTYWVGDSLDGEVARFRGQESLIGAVFDIVCDRASTMLLAGAFIATYPEVTGPLVLYLFQFAVLDTMLSFAFLLWPWTLSPNYFYKVDRPIYRWNWSRAAKALNTGGVVITLVLGYHWDMMALPYAVSGGIVVLKVVSLVRLIRIVRGTTHASPSQG
jgi:CDP-diacylglycerol--glycerol-3-phosphate 3-phosphatidyltransferase